MIIHGNNIDKLKEFPDNYFDSIVTDPPYGLGKEPDAVELMKDWVEKGYHEITGSGFMGKEWDAFVPQPIFWKEVFRVLKHGGHVLSFFGTRTYDWGVMSMRFAGFEVRDCIQWVYGNGFPKSHNISKAIDKIYGAEREVTGQRISAYGDSEKSETDDGRNLWGKESTKEVFLKNKPASEEAKEWDGWGSALKPATEPIVLARKPLEKGLSIAENVLKWGTGAINIDASRIGMKKEDFDSYVKKRLSFDNVDVNKGWKNSSKNLSAEEYIENSSQGRFPANLILTHHHDCVCKGLKKVGSGERKNHEDGEVSNANEGYKRPNKSSYTHKDSSVIASYGEETIEHWECVDGCPIKIMDEQSGETKSQRSERGNILNNNVFGKYNPQENTTRGYNDLGGASRFFYVAKASKSERNRGLSEFEEKKPQHDFGTDFGESRSTRTHTPTKNFHPTVKPVKLMQYLVRLITPPFGKVLDPFCGSGTTGIACKLEGFEFVGIEQDAEYCKIAEARIVNYTEEQEEELKLIEENQENKATQLELF